MHVGMPENKPATERLPDIDGQNQKGRAVTDKTDQDRIVDDILQLIFCDNVFEKTGKKSAAAQSDHRQIRPYPQGKSVVVVHVGLIEALEPAQQHGIYAP